MAFSGQYAAAQLHKLDGLLPCHFALAKEVAEYLGFAPDAVPPSHLTCARALGRLPSMQICRYQVFVHMYEHELTGDGMVWARIVRFSGDRLEIRNIQGTLQEVQDQAGDSVPYSYSVSIDVVPEDREFFARWVARYGRAWPDVDVYSMHPVLRGANKILGEVITRWREQDDLQLTIVHRHNRLLPDSDNS
jgi:hypothetical protein